MTEALLRAAASAALLAVLTSVSGCERPAEAALGDARGSRVDGPPSAPEAQGQGGKPKLDPAMFGAPKLVEGVKEAIRAIEVEQAAAAGPGASPERRRGMTLIAGGDVSFGRMIGQILLREPGRELFTTLAPLLQSADVRFCNLESQLSDQKGETVSPRNNLVFTGPPAGADALARAGFTIVSTANNHAWDYGKKALFETMDNLDRAGVRYVGTGRSRPEAYKPVFIEHGGVRLAILAVTDIWNQGSLWKHPAVEYVAGADFATLPVAVRALRADPTVDFIAVSYHGLAEYIDEPMQRTREILHAVMDAGADMVLGHHPHVVQGVEWKRGKPILYSLGNLLMRMNSKQPWTEFGYMARVRLVPGEAPSVEACPFRMHGIAPLRFVGDPLRATYERRFFGHLTSISKRVGGSTIGAPGDDGCAPLSPPVPKAPPAPKKK